MLQNKSALDIQGMEALLAKEGSCIIDDWELKSQVKLARDEYYQSMKVCKLAPQKQKFHYTDLNTKPHRKLAIGSTNGIGDPYAQFLQTTYFSKDDPQYSKLGSIFGYLISLRNRILGIAEDFGNDPKRDGFWNACRVHHYPSGGGFMVGHRDTHFPALLEKAGTPFLQVLVLLSERGEDFHTGGGYVVNRAGEKKYYEDTNSLGNIVCFDGSIIHGVDDVDNDQIIDFNSTKGRLAGFVGLYKVLN